jgi:hypothetical protein
MLRTRAFVTDLARAGKDYQETKAAAIEGAYGDQTLQKMVISAILKKVKAGRSTKHHLKPIKPSELHPSKPLLLLPSQKTAAYPWK